jgi:hypothetical protein
MRNGWMIGAALATVLGACASGPASDESVAGPTSEADVPRGFDAWLAEQCPDGAVLGLVDESAEAGAGRVVRTASCEQVRARVLADPSTREPLVAVYLGRAAGAQPSGDERVGAAREPWSPVGLVCGIITASLGLAFNPPGAQWGCKDPRAEHPRACEAATVGGSALLSLPCVLI